MDISREEQRAALEERIRALIHERNAAPEPRRTILARQIADAREQLKLLR